MCRPRRHRLLDHPAPDGVVDLGIEEKILDFCAVRPATQHAPEDPHLSRKLRFDGREILGGFLNDQHAEHLSIEIRARE
jgi:hypothetical protein